MRSVICTCSWQMLKLHCSLVKDYSFLCDSFPRQGESSSICAMFAKMRVTTCARPAHWNITVALFATTALSRFEASGSRHAVANLKGKADFTRFWISTFIYTDYCVSSLSKNDSPAENRFLNREFGRFVIGLLLKFSILRKITVSLFYLANAYRTFCTR